MSFMNISKTWKGGSAWRRKAMEGVVTPRKDVVEPPLVAGEGEEEKYIEEDEYC
jgi:hypothetical protein